MSCTFHDFSWARLQAVDCPLTPSAGPSMGATLNVIQLQHNKDIQEKQEKKVHALSVYRWLSVVRSSGFRQSAHRRLNISAGRHSRSKVCHNWGHERGVTIIPPDSHR